MRDVIAQGTQRVFLLFLISVVNASAGAQTKPSVPSQWRADHHMHLSSADLCRRLRDCEDCACIESNHPPSVLAADAVEALDAADVEKGLVLSGAYLYGLPSLHLSPEEIAKYERKENEFTAVEVAKFPGRLVAFFSVDPLQPGALEEIRYWAGKPQFAGLKLHFIASAVNIRSAEHREKLRAVLAEAAKNHLPLVIHVGGGDFNDSDAELFIREVLPSAGDSWVQLAHAAGGSANHRWDNLRVLSCFADHIVADDPRTRRVLFDLSFVPGPQDSPDEAKMLAGQIRRIGMKRFLFGSDFNVMMPKDAVANLKRLNLTKAEWNTLAQNCAPWVCKSK